MGNNPGREKILVINPGGTSTKIAVYEGDAPEFVENIRHPAADVARFETVYDQLEWRLDVIRRCLADHGHAATRFDAVVGRGGPLAPVPSGVFAVDEEMLGAIRRGEVLVHHPALLGAPMARAIADASGCPAYVVDPVCVDEMLPEAKVTGLPAVPRRALSST